MVDSKYVMKSMGKYYAGWLRAAFRYSKEARDLVMRALKATKALEYVNFALQTANDVVETIEEFFPSTKKMFKTWAMALKWLEGVSRELIIYMNEFFDILVDLAEKSQDLVA